MEGQTPSTMPPRPLSAAHKLFLPFRSRDFGGPQLSTSHYRLAGCPRLAPEAVSVYRGAGT